MSQSTSITKLPQGNAPAPADAAALYHLLSDRARSAQKKANLSRIWNALEALRAEAERRKRPAKYTIAEVRRQLASAGTPIGESTILNKGQGDDYQALIKTYDAQYAAPADSNAPDEAWAFEIEDPRLQARIRIVLQQNRSLQKRLEIIRRDYLALVRAEPSEPRPSEPREGAPIFTPRESRAVRRFLESAADSGWQIDETSGAILDPDGMELAEPGFVHALRRIAGT